MSNIAIKVENLSKAYQLGQIGTGTISRDLERWYARMRGKEDPFLLIGESNNQNIKSKSDIVWSLKDINFEIEQGDAVGIIGRNGAGKSTLLKILSKVTAPTTGKISGKGRIASLLEVGTGFHPELSGRENIFLNGAILGMRKKEIQRKLDEIVDFAGIERYLDTPVKRYSSGMYVRLAFAVAAHLESEILIVDEVLAVGDAEFQKKCLGKMGEVSKGEGRTVLFVSHNMESINRLCNKGLLLQNGASSNCNDIKKTIHDYLNQNKNISRLDLIPNYSRNVEVTSVQLKNHEGITTSEICILEPWSITVDFLVNENIEGLICAIGIESLGGIPLKTTWHEISSFKKGSYKATFFEEETHYSTGIYLVHVGLSKNKQNIQFLEAAIQFEIVIGRTSLDINKLDYSPSTGILVNYMRSQIIKND